MPRQVTVPRESQLNRHQRSTHEAIQLPRLPFPVRAALFSSLTLTAILRCPRRATLPTISCSAYRRLGRQKQPRALPAPRSCPYSTANPNGKLGLAYTRTPSSLILHGRVSAFSDALSICRQMYCLFGQKSTHVDFLEE